MSKDKNVTNPAVATPVVMPAQQPPTPAEQIWAEIKDKEILMFSLPGQVVSNYCQPVFIDPTRCFLVSKASSVLPGLEEALRPKKDPRTGELVGHEYELTAADKYIIVSRKPKNAF